MVDNQLVEVLARLTEAINKLGVPLAVFAVGLGGLRQVLEGGETWREACKNAAKGLVLILGARSIVWVMQTIINQAVSVVKP